MINPAIFKAYDIRGKYPKEINEEAVAEIAGALAGYFERKAKSLPAGRHGVKRKIIVVGHDARLSSPSLYETVIHSLKIENWKLEIEAVGLITTPMLYFLVNNLKAIGGIMITASHNPKEFNGLKIVGPKAEMISGETVKKLIS